MHGLRLAAGVMNMFGRGEGIAEIMRFVHDHPESYASLAVCRRALDGGLDRVTGTTLNELQQYLEDDASDDEIEAYFSIIS